MFVRNLDAFTQALGVQNAGVIFELAQVPWQSDDERNDFIFKLSIGLKIQTKF
jgi:hypothetical protein